MKIKELRNCMGISQKELGNVLGVARNTISQYENGQREPDFETLQKIADYFGVSVDYVLGRTDEKGGASTVSDEEAALDAELIWRLTHLTPVEQREVDAFVQGLLASRGARTFRPASEE